MRPALPTQGESESFLNPQEVRERPTLRALRCTRASTALERNKHHRYSQHHQPGDERRAGRVLREELRNGPPRYRNGKNEGHRDADVAADHVAQMGGDIAADGADKAKSDRHGGEGGQPVQPGELPGRDNPETAEAHVVHGRHPQVAHGAVDAVSPPPNDLERADCEYEQRGDVSPASIKYHLREGLLPSGDAIHATRAEYSARHLDRLQLIQALRRIVGLNIRQIGGLLEMADDGVPRLDLLAAVQRVVLHLDNYTPASGGVSGAAADAVVRLRGWPDAPSDARNALNAHFELMASLGIPVSAELLETYSRAMDEVASLDIAATTAPESIDQLILTAAVGMHTHSQLLLKLLALAQASHAIRRYEGTLKAQRSRTKVRERHGKTHQK